MMEENGRKMKRERKWREDRKENKRGEPGRVMIDLLKGRETERVSERERQRQRVSERMKEERCNVGSHQECK